MSSRSRRRPRRRLRYLRWPGSRSRRRRRSRHLRDVAIGVLVASLLLVGFAAILAFDALQVQAALATTERDVRAGYDQVEEGNLLGASETVARVRGEIGPAVRRVNRLSWRVGERMPFVGATLQAGRGMVMVIDRSSVIGRNALDVMDLLLDDNGEVHIQADDGQLPVQMLAAVGEIASALDVEALGEGLDLLREVRGPLPAEVAVAREHLLELGTDLWIRAGRVRGVLSAAPVTLGARGERSYLLGMQNPAELRGTGGLLGFIAIVTAENGRLTLRAPSAYGALDVVGEDPDEPWESEAPERFFRRYGAVAGPGHVANINLDPDLPTVAPVLLEMIEARTGARLDGVIIVDPIAVQRIITEIGPVVLDDEVAATAADLPNPVPPERFADITLTEHYASFEHDNDARREYLVEISSAAFRMMFDGGWDGVEVVRALVDAASGGHVAIYEREREVQAAYARADLVGTLEAPDRAGDLLAVTANNSAGNKLDRLVVHHLDITVELHDLNRRGEATRHAEVGLAVTNPVRRGELSPYVAGPSEFLGPDAPEGVEGPAAQSRTWFSFWTGAQGSLETRGDGAIPGSWVIRGQRVADALVNVPAGGHGAISAVGEGPVRLRRDGSGWIYTLDLRRPPKAIADELDLEVVVPDGWRVADAVVHGGIAAAGLGGDLQWAVNDRGLRLWGEATASLRLEVLLTRG